MSVSAGHTTPVGRDRELARLRQLAEHAGGGCGVLALVVGDPGMGKSCLVAQAAAHCRELGFDVFSGGADPTEQHWPFGVLAHALDRRLDPDMCISTLITRSGWNNQPLGGDALPGAELRLIDLLLQRLRHRCATGPIVLIMEDLHWADSSSLAAIARLGRVAHDLPLLILCTLRPGSPRPEVARFVAAMTRRDTPTIELAALPDDAVLALASTSLGGPPGPRLSRLLRATGGNPFYLTELLDAVAADGTATPTASGSIDLPDDRLPPSVVATVLRQLRMLPAAALDVLRAASLLGHTFSVGELKLALSRPTAELAIGLRPAREAGLLAECGDRLAFKHELIRQIIYHEIPRAVRSSWHRDVAEAFARAGVPAERVASHLIAGAECGDRQDGVTLDPPRRRQHPYASWNGLTPAQRTVAGLLAQGLSNAEIAERLYVSRRTVESHVSAALHKLGVSSRLQLAATATRHLVG
jgi:predicted ATPase/DNA-binding CsgD family transcriptional regulator